MTEMHIYSQGRKPPVPGLKTKPITISGEPDPRFIRPGTRIPDYYRWPLPDGCLIDTMPNLYSAVDEPWVRVEPKPLKVFRHADFEGETVFYADDDSEHQIFMGLGAIDPTMPENHGLKRIDE